MICVRYELSEQAVRTEYRIPSVAELGVEYQDAWKLPPNCPGCHDRVRVGSVPLKEMYADSTYSGNTSVCVSLTVAFLYCADCAERFRRLKLFEKRYYRCLLLLFVTALSAIGIGFAVPQAYQGVLIGFAGVLLGLLLVAYCAGASVFRKRKRRVCGWRARPLRREISFDNNEIGVSFALANGFQIREVTGGEPIRRDMRTELGGVLASHAISHGHVLLRRR